MTLYITQSVSAPLQGGVHSRGSSSSPSLPSSSSSSPRSPPKSEDSGGYAHKLMAKCILKKHERHTYRAFRNGGGNSTPSSKSALISSVFSGTVLYCTASVCLCVWGKERDLMGVEEREGERRAAIPKCCLLSLRSISP